MKKLIKQLFKFGIIGVIAFFIDYALLYVCTEWLGIYYLLSSIISFSISVVFNYIASIIWVFETDKEANKTKQFVIFMILSIFGLAINQFIMWYGVNQINVYYMFVKLVATAIVMIFNFITRKIFLEKRRISE